MTENPGLSGFEHIWKAHYKSVSDKHNRRTFLIILFVASVLLVSDTLFSEFPACLFVVRLCATVVGFGVYLLFRTGKLGNQLMILLYTVPALNIANFMAASGTDAINIVLSSSYVVIFGFAMVSILFMSPGVWIIISTTTIAGYLVQVLIFGTYSPGSYLHYGGTILILSYIGFPYVAGIRYRLSRENFELHSENERQRAELEYLANNDSLAGCLNRRGGINMLEYLTDLSKRHGFSLSVCFIDMDGLKAVNDRWGHAEGDNFIRMLSEVVHENIRKSDTLFRYGGDEFVVIFHGCNPAESEMIIKKIEQAAAAVNNPYPLSFSCGIVEYDGRMSADELITRADMIMYENKMGKRPGLR